MTKKGMFLTLIIRNELDKGRLLKRFPRMFAKKYPQYL
jgi:hypothetical protein